MPQSTRSALFCGNLFLLALLMGASASDGQILNNTRFDTDVSGWSEPDMAIVVWDPLDADASLTSGSALVTNISDTAGDGTGARQCAEGIDEAVTYQVGARVYFPGGQTETGWAVILVQSYSGAACTDFIDFELTSIVQSTSTDAWLPVSASLVAPAGSQSVRVRLSVRKQEAAGSLAAHFDNVVFESVIFSDSFESGDTSAWSSTVQ